MKKEDKLEEKVQELEKSNRWMKGILLALIGIFFIALCFGFGFVLGKEMSSITDGNSSEEKENVNEGVQLEKLTVDSKIVKDLFEIFREDTSCMMATLWEDQEELDAKKYIAYSQLEESDFYDRVCNTLNATITSDGHYCNLDEDYSRTTVTFSSEKLKEKYVQLFGNDGYVDGNFEIAYGPIAYYDSVNKLYAKFNCFCGGECGMAFTHVLESIEQSGTTLKLITALKEDDEMEISRTEIIYTFEYQKTTGNYIFVSRVKK